MIKASAHPALTRIPGVVLSDSLSSGAYDKPRVIKLFTTVDVQLSI